ncbi:helix-turn-helix domain-containing protein [Robertmurraya korlensis]|uniref:helix-turn-helix domain-containing protein n=1 Tax=Robertmurraya korlensis TaxID=519977 RepID=UPI00203C25DD|nr:helix-turn-helix domain-containing protein [Robertmurraya korlensis]
MNFGRNFIKARTRKGMDQKDAAAALEISPAFLSKVENDKSKPSIDLILKASELYKVEPGFFFEGQQEIDLSSLYTEKNKAFINDLNDLTDSQLRDKYKIQLDGKELSETELKGIMAYVRSLRAME